MIGGIIKKLLGGSESGADLKEINPLVEKAKEEFAKLSQISNDELREKSASFRKRIASYISDEENQLVDLEKRANAANTAITEKEQLYASIDKIKKEIDNKLEIILEEINPSSGFG